MPTWAKTFVLLSGTLGWLAVVGGQLWSQKTPDAWIMGFPVGLWMALTGEPRITRRRVSASRTGEPAAATDRESSE